MGGEDLRHDSPILQCERGIGLPEAKSEIDSLLLPSVSTSLCLFLGI